MARQESDREDLWAEAVALTTRAEFQLPQDERLVLIGYRDNGWCSIYLGQNVMLQFTPEGRLRRAFREGVLYRSQGTTLSRLRRQRTETETVLLRSELSSAELTEFQEFSAGIIRQLLQAITSGKALAQRTVNPQTEPLTERITTTLTGILTADEFLASAIVKGR